MNKDQILSLWVGGYIAIGLCVGGLWEYHKAHDNSSGLRGKDFFEGCLVTYAILIGVTFIRLAFNRGLTQGLLFIMFLAFAFSAVKYYKTR